MFYSKGTPKALFQGNSKGIIPGELQRHFIFQGHSKGFIPRALQRHYSKGTPNVLF